MTSFPTPQRYIFSNFKGIRTRNGIAQNGTISATVCQNIDFAPSSYDAGIDIRTTYGNAKIAQYSSLFDGVIIKGFETEQEGVKYLLFYTENSTKGQLVKYNNGSNTFSVLIDNLSVTGEANGITMIDSAYDIFIFTNGIEYYSVQLTPIQTVTKLQPQYDGNAVKGLALAEQDGSLVIGCNNGIVLASRKGDITDFDYNASQDDNKAWYQIFGKKVTAIVPYIDALLVFTEEDSTVLSGNFSNPASATRLDASLGGCMSYESWCKHDKYLFFYDNRQKNIYYYMQNNYGQKVLGEPIAPEVQKFFNNITRLQMVSYIGNNRSEIWLLSDNFKLIFDYFVKEWTQRVCQPLTSYFVYDNEVYSTGSSKIFKEKSGNMCLFDGVYYPAKYTTQIINLGTFSNAKEMDIYPLLSVAQAFNNTFYIECLVDGKKIKRKNIKMYFQGAIWADNSAQTTETSDNELWAEGSNPADLTALGQVFPDESNILIRQIKGKIIPFWYYLQFTIGTTKRGDDFSISCFELKGITQEYDTTGRK